MTTNDLELPAVDEAKIDEDFYNSLSIGVRVALKYPTPSPIKALPNTPPPTGNFKKPTIEGINKLAVRQAFRDLRKERAKENEKAGKKSRGRRPEAKELEDLAMKFLIKLVEPEITNPKRLTMKLFLGNDKANALILGTTETKANKAKDLLRKAGVIFVKHKQYDQGTTSVWLIRFEYLITKENTMDKKKATESWVKTRREYIVKTYNDHYVESFDWAVEVTMEELEESIAQGYSWTGKDFIIRLYQNINWRLYSTYAEFRTDCYL